MKIVLIHGQNHKGSSYHIGRLVAEKLGSGNEIREFFLPKDLEHFCRGCYKCIDDESRCPFYIQKKAIMENIENAELLIFTTPTYCMRASAPMKSFMDLTFTYWMIHRPRKAMFKKKAVVISTAAGRGMKTAIKDISNTLFYWGIPIIRHYGIAVQAMSWEQMADDKKEKIQKDTTKLASSLLRKKVKVGMKTKFMFYIMRMMQKADRGASPIEKKYWQDNGWLDKKRPWHEE
ncbi:MAG: NAD(P)H-dependent oxidoreductase [Lachnospiraceae bacterium]|nr:NAD(P)H-dependent oxidoreductase [Lachnospiraceae bacterium]